MAAVIRELDPHHPVTCGLHVESLVQDNGLRVSDVFAETDVALLHGYPMYADWAKGPLDPDYVPFTCALTTALSGKPTLVEAWGTTSPRSCRGFARTRPRVRPAARRIDLDGTPDASYADPAGHAQRLYAAYLARGARP